MAFAKVQSTSGNGSGTGLTASKALTSAPGVGNLLLAFIFTGDGAVVTTLTFDTTKWTPFDRAVGGTGGDQAIVGLYRYVQSGDTTAMPAFCTAGSTFFAYAVEEISGVSGSWATDYQGSTTRQAHAVNTSIVAFKSHNVAAGAFALCAFAKYDEGSLATPPTGWTSDENAVNFSNYGAYGLAHQALASANTSVTATANFASSSSHTIGIMTVILTPSQPTTPTVVRVFRGAQGINWPGSVTLYGTPKVGNLLLGFISWKDGGSAGPTVNAASWSQFASALNGSNPIALGLERYVQSGDTAVLASLCTAGSGAWSVNVVEVSGVSGTFASDHISDKAGYQATGATFVTTADATTGPNQVAITHYAEFAGTADPSVTGADAQALANSSSTYGAWGLSVDYEASSSAAIQSTWTPSSSTHKQGYIQSIFGSASTPGGGNAGIGTITLSAPLVTAELKVGAGIGTIAFNPPKARALIGAAGDARATQAVRMTLVDVTRKARATQAARIAVIGVDAKARASQAVRLTIMDLHVDCRTTQAIRLTVADVVNCVTFWCQCWRITRRDGRVFLFTSLDEDFQWGTELFLSCASLSASAAQSNTDIGEAGSVEISGIISDSTISEADLYGGRFDDAFVEVWLVAYQGTDTPRRIGAGWAGNLSHGEQGFNMDVMGPGARLSQQPLVKAYTPTCRWKFGSPECGVNADALKLAGEVSTATGRGALTATVSPNSNVVLSGASSGAVDVQWVNATLEWTSGANAGSVCEVKTVKFETGTDDVSIVLWALAQSVPEAGDTFDLKPGCDFLRDGGCAVYNNIINFGGFPDVPGNDSIQQTPNA